MRSLLPPNSTELERAIEHLIIRSFYDRPRLISGAKFNPTLRRALHSDLVYEWSLAPLEPFIPTDRILDEGVQWSRIKGSVAAVEWALQWIGLISATVEETGPTTQFNRIQLDSGCIPSFKQITDTRELARLSLPVRAVFNRIYHGYDRRVLRLSTGDTFSDQHLSDDSGVWIDDGMKLSFGRSSQFSTKLNIDQLCSDLVSVRTHTSQSLYPDVLRYGTAYFGDKPVLNHTMARGRLIGLSTESPLSNPKLIQKKRRIARLAFVLSESILGEVNTRFGGSYKHPAAKFFWSDPDCRLSDVVSQQIKIPIEELYVVTHYITTTLPPNFLQNLHTFQHRQHQSIASWISHDLRWSDQCVSEKTGSRSTHRTHHITATGIGSRSSQYGWTGMWDSRSWTGDISLTHYRTH